MDFLGTTRPFVLLAGEIGDDHKSEAFNLELFMAESLFSESIQTSIDSIKVGAQLGADRCRRMFRLVYKSAKTCLARTPTT